MRMFNPPHPGEVLHDYLEDEHHPGDFPASDIALPVIPYPQWTCTSDG